jgi:2-keto-myo-inositol isomerase
MIKPAISEASTMPSTFVQDVEAYAAAGVAGMEVWLTKLETAVADRPAADLRKLVSDKGITLAAASYQGGLMLSQGEARQAHFDHFKRRLDLCQQFAIDTMLIAADFAPKTTPTDWERAIVSLKQAGQWAAGFGVRLALEFRGVDAFCTSLDTALMLVAQCREPNIGVNLDVFHFYKGPSKLEDLDQLTKENLAFVQLCDVAGVPRELMTDSDRVLPGDGEFRLAPIFARLRQIAYDRWVSLELFNPVLWQIKPTQLAELGLSALQRVIEAP